MANFARAEVASPTTLEYRAVFAEPIFEAWVRRTEILASLFRALKPWGLQLTDIETRDEGSGNARLEFGIPSQRMTLVVSLGYLSAIVTKPDWSQVQSIIDILQRATEGVVSSSGAAVSLQTVNLAMHLVPRERDLKSILSRLSNPGLAGALASDALAWGFAVYGPRGYRIIDVSRVVPGAIYIGLHRSFESSDQLEDGAKWLREEEDEVLKLLELSLE